MQFESVIEFAEVTKTYPAKHHPFMRMAEAIIGRSLATSIEASESGFVALKGVNFKVGAGEAVGLIGRNGAGKSTLLQIMAGVLQPSSGHFSVRGRLAALLELGAGFNPEFTGRENVALAGAMVGIQSSEMGRYAEEVLDFSELGEAFERPVKTYSSGMYARLGFSAYICQRPEIMVIDEALSVGDMRFQNKCFSRISELRELGTTFIFVSHNLAAVRLLCERAIWIEGGRVQEDGDSQHVTDVFERFMSRGASAARSAPDVEANVEHDGLQVALAERGEHDGSGVFLEAMHLRGEIADHLLQTGRSLEVIFDVCSSHELPNASLGLAFSRDGIGDVCRLNNLRDDKPISLKAGRNSITLRIPAMPLLTGRYAMSVYLASADLSETYHRVESAYFLEMVTPMSPMGWRRFDGIVAIPHEWVGQ